MDNTIYKTTEYKFDVVLNQLKGNRRLSKSHIRKLAESIGQDASSLPYSPIIVNEKNQIIDGQHRYAACEQLGLPVYYMVWKGSTIEDAQRLNANSKNWTPWDYAFSFASQRNDNYAKYILFKQHYGLNHDIAMRYLALGEPMTTTMFKSGKMIVVDFAKSKQIAEALLELGDYYEGYKRRSFALAFLTIWLYGNYNHEHMIRQCRLWGKKAFRDYPLQADNERMIEKIYNYGSADKTRLS